MTPNPSPEPTAIRDAEEDEREACRAWNCQTMTSGSPAEAWLARSRIAHTDLARAREEIAGLRREVEWHPIETAPKDGDCILVCRPGFNGKIVVEDAYWDARFTSTYNEDTDENEYVGAWTNNEVQDWGYEELQSIEPTHWKPLPKPPALTTTAPKEPDHG